MPLYGQIYTLINLNRLFAVGKSCCYIQVTVGVLALLLLYTPMSYAKPANNDQVDQRTHNIRAAYLFNLLRFLSWHQDSPHNTSKVINLCTSASDLEYQTLQKLESKQVNGKAIKVIRLPTKKTKASPNNCHIAYLVSGNNQSKSSANKKTINAINQYHSHKAVTVGNGKHFIDQGGIVAIVLNNNRMRLDINYRKAKEIGVRMSANLLEVAHIVH